MTKYQYLNSGMRTLTLISESLASKIRSSMPRSSPLRPSPTLVRVPVSKSSASKLESSTPVFEPNQIQDLLDLEQALDHSASPLKVMMRLIYAN